MAGRREVLGTWDDVFASVEPAHGLLAQEARDLILRLHPASVMTARPGDRAVTFGFGPRKMTDGYVYLMPQRTSVNLGFYQGALLPDPSRLLRGTGKVLRHVKLREPAELAQPELAGLVAAAIAERAAALQLEVGT